MDESGPEAECKEEVKEKVKEEPNEAGAKGGASVDWYHARRFVLRVIFL